MSERYLGGSEPWFGFKKQWEGGMGTITRWTVVLAGLTALVEVGGAAIAAEGGVVPALESAGEPYLDTIAQYTPKIG